MVTPAFLPSARIACSERCRCGPASTCTVMMSAPALAKASRCGSTGAIIRCTSSVFCVIGRSAFTTSGPKVMTGTKWPSITSRWIQSAPAASTARTSSASLEKSEARIDGRDAERAGHDASVYVAVTRAGKAGNAAGGWSCRTRSKLPGGRAAGNFCAAQAAIFQMPSWVFALARLLLEVPAGRVRCQSRCVMSVSSVGSSNPYSYLQQASSAG